MSPAHVKASPGRRAVFGVDEWRQTAVVLILVIRLVTQGSLFDWEKLPSFVFWGLLWPWALEDQLYVVRRHLRDADRYSILGIDAYLLTTSHDRSQAVARLITYPNPFCTCLAALPIAVLSSRPTRSRNNSDVHGGTLEHLLQRCQWYERERRTRNSSEKYINGKSETG